MSAQYKAEISKYTKKDGITALCFFAFWVICHVAMIILADIFGAAFIIATVFNILLVAACFAVVIIKKQGLSSIGFRKKNLWPALRLGLLFSIIPLILNFGILPGIIYSWEPRSLGMILSLSVGTFIFAAREDIIFVGYIQTRLYGLIKSDILAISFGAFLFSIMHLVSPLVRSGLAAFNTQNLIWLFACFILHFVFNALFRRYFIIFSTIILHTMSNIAGQGNLWNIGEYAVTPSQSLLWAWLTILALVLSVGIWSLYVRRRSDTVSVEHM